ncbi:PAS domain-containing sensor histidine kinase [Halarcobacter sp.]|uniref:PAS domain-containing sensor histidine kinase n=1 Tax=Halarcobacter sp. TaxID=2321133 RepID=UPI0029F55340|nr:PAS domain-containing sensor histidine kinase [Halarcobacter sp.]
MKDKKFAFFLSLIYFIFTFIFFIAFDTIIEFLFTNNEFQNNLLENKEWIYLTLTTPIIFIFTIFILKNYRENLENLEELLDKTPIAIIVSNEDGRVLLINKSFKQLTEYTLEDINSIEKITTKIFGSNTKLIKKSIKLLYLRNKTQDNGEFEILKKNGDKITLNFKTSPFRTINNKKTLITTAIDVTGEKEQHKLLMQELKMSAMDEILQNISHQWRQPLSSISTVSTALRLQNDLGQTSYKDIDNTMEIINNSAQYLSKTIEDFRGFFKPDQKKTHFSINEIFDKSLQIIGNSFEKDSIKFDTDIKEFKIYNYSNALLQVMLNIFNNSKDSFNKNKVTNRVIFIEAYTNEYNLIIQIKDTAGGIPTKILNKVFEPYFTTKHQSVGTGMGLYMSQEMITKHMGGKIWVDNKMFTYNSKSYTGAVFTISLPISTI